MEKLPTSKRAAILRSLVEGCSIASTTRMVGANKRTILNLIRDAGEALEDYMARMMVNLPCKVLQLDELHSFVGCKNSNKANAVGDHPGSVWTWTSICESTKLMPHWHVGERDGLSASEFCFELANRCQNVEQITTDGLSDYRMAVGNYFPDTDFAQLVKIYGKDSRGNDTVIGIRKRTIQGRPDVDKINTAFVERSNLTIRMSNRRYTRKTNGFSKKLEAHCDMLAIGFTAYNFVRKHMTLKTTPAVAAGVASRPLRMEELIEEVDTYARRKMDAAYEAEFAKLP